MLNKALIAVLISLLSMIAVAESISVTVKPEKGFAGLTSLNIHEDGNVTVLVYESAAKINENTLDLEPERKKLLRLQSLSTIDSYLKQSNYDSLNTVTFTTSIAHTTDGVTKNISSKRLNEEATELIMQLIELVPGNSLDYVREEI
jgi:hypothetical protein